MGIRIEVCPTFLMFSITNAKVVASQDEVLVGKDHPTILSVNAPKEVCNSVLVNRWLWIDNEASRLPMSKEHAKVYWISVHFNTSTVSRMSYT